MISRLITIEGRDIGAGFLTYVIAEAGINHNGSRQIAKLLVDTAVEADAVKFQKRNIDNTYVEDIINDPSIAEMEIEYTVSNLKEVLLTDDQLKELANYAYEQGIDFLCSP